jgi:hypothetical protein
MNMQDTLIKKGIKLKTVAGVKDFKEEAEREMKELGESMKSSRRQETVRKEIEKIRKDGKMKEDSIYDIHKIINEAEKRIKDKMK